MTQMSKSQSDSDEKGAAPSVAGSGIRLSDVSYSLDGKQLFDALSLTITERRVALIGRNGSGKSTLSRLICGLVAPDEGSIAVNDIDVLEDRTAAIKTIGLIFQNPDHQIIFPTVEEEIAFGLESLLGNKEEARHRAQTFLGSFGRSDWAERNTFSLSQGQRHLVCLMAVLAMQPSVILLDEPFAGLDLPTTRHLFAWLDALEQQVLLVTHDIDEVDQFDRIIWLEKGAVQADGPPRDVIPAYREAMERLIDSPDQDLDLPNLLSNPERKMQERA